MHSFDRLQTRHPNIHLIQNDATCIGRLLANMWLGSNAPNAGVSLVALLHQHMRKASCGMQRPWLAGKLQPEL